MSFVRCRGGSALVSNIPASYGVTPSGATSYSIPIEVPPGRRGMAPSVALSYQSSTSAGLAGVGWNVASLSAITRCNWTVAQDGSAKAVEYIQGDGYCLDGARLVKISGTYGAGESVYRTEIDSFSRVTAKTSGGAGGAASGGPKWFEVYGRDGLIYTYGETVDSRIDAFPGTSSSPVRVWALSRIRDRSNNTIDYQYLKDGDSSSYRISAIRYTGTTIATGPQAVVFEYQARSMSDVHRWFVGGAAIDLEHQLWKIRTEHNGSTIRQYELTYETSTATGATRLKGVGLSADGALVSETAFTWTTGGVGWDTGYTQTQVPAGTATAAFLVDQNGNGRSDLLFPNAGYWHLVNFDENGAPTSNGVSTGIPEGESVSAWTLELDGDGLRDLFAPGVTGVPYKMLRSTGDSGAGFVDEGCQAFSGCYVGATGADVDGDGYDDIAYGATNGVAVHRNTGSYSGGTRFAPAVVAYQLSGESYPTNTFITTSQSLAGTPVPVDFDGDGRGDLLQLVTRTREISCGGEPGCTPGVVDTSYWSTLRSVSVPGTPAFVAYGTLGRADEIGYLRALDLNGDGLTDVAYVYGGTWWTRLSTGAGFTAAVNSGVAAVNPDKARAVDYDGDGWTDIIYPPASGQWRVLRSNGATLVAGPATGLTNGGNKSAVRIADVDGDGDPDVLVPFGNPSKWRIYYHNGVPGDRLASAIDSYGNTFEPTYSFLTKAATYTKGSGGASPAYQDYAGPVMVAKSFDASNGIGGEFTMTYTYEAARVNRQGRGFLGFGRVTGVDSRNGVRSITDYQQQFPYTGLAQQATVKQSNGKVITQSSSTWTPAPAVPYRVLLEEQTTLQNEVGGLSDGQLASTVTVENSYDALGVLTHQVRTVTARDGANYVTTVDNTPQNDTTNWCLGLLSSASTTMQLPTVPATLNRSFTNDTVKCRVNTETQGASNVLGYAVPAVTTSFEYGDAWGNVTKTTVTSGTESRWVSVGFGTDGYFPRVVNNPAGLPVTRTFDYRNGQVLSEQDPNGIAVSSQYDALGFLASQDFPDGTEVVLTRQPFTTLANSAYKVVMQERFNGVAASQAEAIFDRQNRTLRQIVFLRNGVASYQDTAYDALGRTASVSAPYTSGNPVYQTSYAYDLIGRVTGVTEPASATSTASHAFTYDIDTTLGFKTTYTDPKSKVTTRWTDALGRLRKVTDAANGSTVYGYDPLGNLSQVTDPLGKVVTLKHDDRGARREMTDPSSGKWEYTYTNLGELFTQKDAKNQTYTFGYDPIGRLTSRAGPLGENTTWVYDSASGAGLGRLDQVYMADGFIRSFDYDGLGRVTDVHQTQDSITYDTSFGYDNYGRLASITYPDSPPDGAPAPASISVPPGPHAGGYTVSWAAVTGTAITYELQEAPNPDFTGATLAYSGTATSKAITKSPGSYYYRVRACDGGLCGNYTASSTPAVVVQPAATPTAISVPVGYDTDGAYTISWTVPVGVYSELYESTSSTFTSQTKVYGGTGTSKAISGKGNGTYYYRVRACVNSVPEGCSSYKQGTGGVQVTLPPGVPASISVPSAYDTDGAYTVSWGAVSGAKYELYESTNSSFSPETLAYTGTTASKAFTGKTNGSYYYRVRACNSVNTAACSGWRTGTNPAQVTLPPAVPASITVPTGTNTTGDYLVFWPVQSGGTFKLWQATNSGFTGQTNIYTGTTNSKSFTGQPSGTYYYRVQACNSVNTAACSGYRTAATAVTVLLPPGVPSSISAIPPSGSSKSYTVMWGASTGTVTRYELEYRRYTASWLAAYSGLQLSYGMTVTQNGEYTHRVRACNSSGCSNWRTGALVAVGTIMLITPPPDEGEALPPEPADADLQAQVEHQRQATRLAALMRKQALHQQAWPEQPGSVVGGSGTGYRYWVSYQYDNWGHLAEVREPDNGNRVLWAAEEMDAFGHVKEATLGNGVPVSEILDAATGRMTNIQAGLGSAIQNLSYAWDQAGNLEHRQDLRQGLTETFTYDNLHRLETASVQGGPTMGIEYDAVGNITHKQVTGSADPAANYNLNYQYPANGARLTSISGDLAATMVYDANGSITGGLYTVTWTAFNMPASISKPGQGTSTFKYGPDRQRYRHDYTENGSTVTRHMVGQLFEAVHKTTVEEYHHHVMAYGQVVATHIRRSNGTHGTVWPLKDHLGSVDVVLDEAQQEVARTSFDAFGRRRSALSWDGLPETGTIVGGAREFTNSGYTGHEMLDSVDLVHMNGRVYDPLLGRFLSIDPIVAAPGSTQGWNRYSYVYNNPLAFVDPSGLNCHDSPNPRNRCGGNALDGHPVPDLYTIKPGENLTKEDNACIANREWCQQVRANMGPHRGPVEFEYADPPPPPPNGPVVSMHDSAGGPAYFSAQFDDRPLPAPAGAVVGGALLLSTVPIVGELADARIIQDPNATDFEKLGASISLGASFMSGGLTPNFGVVIRAARGAGRLFPGGVDDVIASAARPSRAGSTTSRAVQALQKKISNTSKAANFGGLKANEATANAIIREAFGAQNPVFRTSTNRAGQEVIDVLNPSTGRGVRLLKESGAFDTFVNF